MLPLVGVTIIYMFCITGKMSVNHSFISRFCSLHEIHAIIRIQKFNDQDKSFLMQGRETTLLLPRNIREMGSSHEWFSPLNFWHSLWGKPGWSWFNRNINPNFNFCLLAVRGKTKKQKKNIPKKKKSTKALCIIKQYISH